MKYILFILLFSFSTKLIYAQESEVITVTGDSLKGKTLNGEMIRIIFGNVVLKQGDIRITCRKAVQFLSDNNVQLIGNVVVTQDSLTITTDSAFYYGDEKTAQSYSGVTLDDKKVILTADSGEYFFREDRAFFTHDVKLFDTVTTLTSSELTYFKNKGRIIAVGNVKIVDPESIIFADSLVHFRENKITFASNNVQINNFENNTIIFGDHLEHYSKQDYTIIDKNPLLLQVDTTFVLVKDSLSTSSNFRRDFRLDTLVIKSRLMEAFRDTVNIFEAKDSVEIVRGRFASVNAFTVYFRNEQKIMTKKMDERIPVLWYENTQVTGDSVLIFLRNNEIALLEIIGHAFILSRDSVYQNRFSQISGERILIHFDDGDITKTEVFGKVHSIYYLYEDRSPNGLIKFSSKSAVIKFENDRVTEVRLYGIPISEYHPENKVKGNELSFTLPGYVFYSSRPDKEELLNGIKIRKPERFKSEINVTK